MQSETQGSNLLNQICGAIRQQTLEPAYKEAEGIIKQANEQAEAIIHKAKLEAEKMHLQATEKINTHKQSIEAALSIAARDMINDLHQQISLHLFKPALSEMVSQLNKMDAPLANILNAISNCFSPNGGFKLELFYSSGLNKEQLSAHLIDRATELLKTGKIDPKIKQGLIIKVQHDKHQFSIDLTEQSLFQLIDRFLSDEIKSICFNPGHIN